MLYKRQKLLDASCTRTIVATVVASCNNVAVSGQGIMESVQHTWLSFNARAIRT
jgi:hypothetical protein